MTSSSSTTKPQPLGVLGGSFDPVHIGHLAIAQAARNHFRLSRVLLVPAGTPPHKSSTVQATPADRRAMLSAAITGIDGLEIWDGELRRAGPSFTVDTLAELRSQFPGSQLHFIIGSDNLDEITTWHRYRSILDLAVLCVTHRPGSELRIPPELTDARISAFPSPELDISSREVRAATASGRPWRHLVPPPVGAYIVERGLYVAQVTHGTGERGPQIDTDVHR